MDDDHGQIRYIALAFLVTFLWASSFIIIKFGLRGLSPLLFAGYRYILASAILLVASLRNKTTRNELFSLSSRSWGIYGTYGLIFIAITQGTGFLSLKLLPAVTVSFVLSLTIIFVILISDITLGERPTKKQFAFIILALVGVLIFFYPLSVIVENKVGLLILVISLLANAISTIMGRGINRSDTTPVIVITTVSMGIGAIALLIAAAIFEGFEMPSLIELVIIVWLAVVNTALTFTIWNYVLRKLTAYEATVIQNSMLPQITILAIIFLGEKVTWYQDIAIVIILVSVVLVQLNNGVKKVNEKSEIT